ncbi:MAG: DNA helicase UvrD, partial [Caldimicrobium sp.]
KKEEDELAKVLPEKLLLAIKKVRQGKVFAKAGYDGVYGIIKIFEDIEDVLDLTPKQKSLFAL